MEIIKKKNIILESSRKFLADAVFPLSESKLPLLIFVHGYKGYKDWGTWDLMGEAFAREGFYFVKFNMSHNGTTLENPKDFEDLEAFGHNNYSKELDDLEIIINYFKKEYEVDASQIILLGHSRGGGISIVKASENKDITRLITFGSVCTLDRFPKNEAFEHWKDRGVYHVLNARTKQEMPHYFQFYQDYENNIDRFSIEKACHKLLIPALFVHGSGDEAVPHWHSENLSSWTKNSQLKIIENAGHTFAAKEPWDSLSLPEEQKIAIESSLSFLKNN